MRFRYWRGALVALIWLLWPPLLFGGAIGLRLIYSPDRSCSIEGCDWPDERAGLVLLIFAIGLPICATVPWLRWRREHRDDPPPA